MEDKARLQQYIGLQRGGGVTDQAIRDKLLSAGWPAETVDKYLLPAGALANSQLPADQPVKNQMKYRTILIGAVVGVCFLLAGGFLLYSLHQPADQEAPTAEPTSEWRDRNYSLDLVEGWQANNDNVPGAGRNAFTNEGLRASLIVYATPSDDSSMNPLDRALANLQTDNGQVTINKGESVMIDDQPRDIQLVTVSYPNSQKNLAYLYVPYADTDYLLEATAPGGQWATTINEIIAIMKSFKPLNKDIRRAQN